MQIDGQVQEIFRDKDIFLQSGFSKCLTIIALYYRCILKSLTLTTNYGTNLILPTLRKSNHCQRWRHVVNHELRLHLLTHWYHITSTTDIKKLTLCMFQWCLWCLY
jgi:hypothetical protein